MVHRLGRGRGVLRGAEPHKAVAEEKHAQVEASALGELPADEEVEPQVELETLNEHRPGDVALHDRRLVLLAALRRTLPEPFQVRGEEDPPALAEVVGLGDVDELRLRAVAELLLQVPEVVGQDPRGRQELVLLREEALHPRHVPREPGLPRERVVHAGEVVHPHPRLDLPKPVAYRPVVDPVHVALRALLLGLHDLPAAGLRSRGDDVVVAVRGVEEHRAALLLLALTLFKDGLLPGRRPRWSGRSVA
mmetsp:Transcript_34264/g.106982  ORF Transcript_34264/g.106982 Transcript_34264/m.106982 type:complete len:249 (-) Transcript_34264:234-980(-)